MSCILGDVLVMSVVRQDDMFAILGICWSISLLISVHDAYLLRKCSATSEVTFECTVGMILR
jgi:hypothetical protein